MEKLIELYWELQDLEAQMKEWDRSARNVRLSWPFRQECAQIKAWLEEKQANKIDEYKEQYNLCQS